MFKKTLPILLTLTITMVFTTIFQPLAFIKSFAHSQTLQTDPNDASPCQQFSQTGWEVCGKQLTYWHKYGGLQQFGYPLSPLFKETSPLDGKEYTVQYFERAVLELHPEKQPPYEILLSQLGTEKYKRMYPFGPSNTARVDAPALDPQPELNVKKQLRPGVSVMLINASQATILGLYEEHCGLEMQWVVQLENTSNSPFIPKLDTNNLKMTDSSGKSYAPTSQCGGTPVSPASGSLVSNLVMNPGDTLKGTISFQVQGIPKSATYFELQASFGGISTKFRYNLP